MQPKLETPQCPLTLPRHHCGLEDTCLTLVSREWSQLAQPGQGRVLSLTPWGPRSGLLLLGGLPEQQGRTTHTGAARPCRSPWGAARDGALCSDH